MVVCVKKRMEAGVVSNEPDRTSRVVECANGCGQDRSLRSEEEGELSLWEGGIEVDLYT